MKILNKFLNRNIIIFTIFISSSLINLPSNKNDKQILSNYPIKKDKPIEVSEEIFLKIPKNHSATWYSLPGNRTYSGEWFYKDSLTAAYNFRGMGTILKVTNLNNNKSVIVKVNDKMGNKSKNIIDLSHGAFKKIASLGHGKIQVKVEELKKESK